MAAAKEAVAHSRRSPRLRPYAPLIHRRFTHWSVWGSLLIVGGALLLPITGTGVDTCPFKHVTELPCVACGLTRSVTCLGHGEVSTSFHFHPFGVLVLGLATFCLVVQFGLPRRQRRRVAAWLTLHHATLRRIYRVVILLFVIFGVLRTIFVGFGVWPDTVTW